LTFWSQLKYTQHLRHCITYKSFRKAVAVHEVSVSKEALQQLTSTGYFVYSFPTLFVPNGVSWDSVVGIATGYGLETGSGVHPTSYPTGPGGSFPGVKQLGREADHSSPVSAEVKKMWIYTSTPPYAFIA
jgi:hypothetical protein